MTRKLVCLPSQSIPMQFDGKNHAITICNLRLNIVGQNRGHFAIFHDDRFAISFLRIFHEIFLGISFLRIFHEIFSPENYWWETKKSEKFFENFEKIFFYEIKFFSRFWHPQSVYITHIKFHQNQSKGSGVIRGDTQTHRQTNFIIRIKPSNSRT